MGVDLRKNEGFEEEKVNSNCRKQKEKERQESNKTFNAGLE